MTPVIVYALTALAVLGLVVVRLLLARSGSAGRAVVGSRLLAAHTLLGAGATVVWVVFLLGPDGSLPGNALVGVVGLGLWWVTALAGLVMLVRPLRGGRHVRGDTSAPGRGEAALPAVAHLGLLAAVLCFTWAYATSTV